MPINSYGRYRGTVRAPSANKDLLTTCPVCGAGPGSRCFALRSWKVPQIPLVGFFTARRGTVHPERRPVRTPHQSSDPRTELRTKIRTLITVKATGSDRRVLRAWAGSSRRTVTELAAKVAELEAMGDIPW